MAPTSTDTSESISFDVTPAPCVEVEEHDGIVSSIDIVWCEYRFSEAYGRRVAELLPLCDGTRGLPEISAALGEPIERVRALVTALYSRAVLQDTSHCEAPADLCQLHLVAAGRTLRARMSAEADLLDGQLHSRRLLGSLVETFHFVSSAAYHLGAAVAHAPSRHIRDGLARIFADEWKHGTDLRKGLKAAGLSDEAIDGSQPLPETQSVINYLRSLASTDLLAYGICAAINESPKTDTAIKESWDSLAQSGLLPPEAIAPFRPRCVS